MASRLPRPYHFPARIQSFQYVATPFPFSLLSSLAPRSRIARRGGAGGGQRSRSRDRLVGADRTTMGSFQFHFEAFQGFAGPPPLRPASETRMARRERAGVRRNGSRVRLEGADRTERWVDSNSVLRLFKGLQARKVSPFPQLQPALGPTPAARDARRSAGRRGFRNDRQREAGRSHDGGRVRWSF